MKQSNLEFGVPTSKMLGKCIIYLTLLAFICIVCLPSVKADLPNNTFDSGDIINVNIYCMQLNNSVCDNSTTSCEITAFYPNTSFLIQQGYMSGNATGFYNHSFGVLNQEGIYSALVHCNNTEEGVVSFDFIVGDIDETHDEYFWFYVAMVLIPLFLSVISYQTKDKTFLILAGFVLCAFALFVIVEGFSRFDNELIQKAVFLVLMGLGWYLILKNGYDLAVEAF